MAASPDAAMSGNRIPLLRKMGPVGRWDHAIFPPHGPTGPTSTAMRLDPADQAASVSASIGATSRRIAARTV